MRKALRPVARNAVWLLLGDVVVKGSMLLVAALVARGLGPAALGVFSVASGAALVAVPLLALGQVEVLIRETAARPGSARELLVGARKLQHRFLLYLLPAAALGFLLVGDSELRATLLAFAPYAVLRMETATTGALFKGLDRMEVEVRARSAEIGLALALVAVTALARAPVWTTGLAFSVGGALGFLLISRRRSDLPAGDASPRPTPFLAMGLPFLGLSVGFQLLLRSDMFLAVAFAVPKQEIGFYGSAGTLVWGLIALPQLAALSLYPTFSRRSADGQGAFPSALLAGGLGLGLGIAAAVGLALFREPLLSLVFGSRFGAAGDLLGRLAWALPGASASMVLGVVIAAWHRQTRGLALTLATLLLSLGLDAYWIPRGGLAAAAAVAVAAHGFAAIGNFALAAWPGVSRARS